MRDNVSTAIKFSAKELVRGMRNKIQRGDIGWEPLSSITAQRKGHDQPLKDRGSLRDSLTSRRVNKLKYEVGIPKGKKNKLGVPLVLVAIVQELGKVVRPKKAKALAVPLTNAARNLIKRYGSARNIPGIFKVRKTRLLAIKEGGTLRPLFLVLDQATIRPRSFIASTLNHQRRTIMNRYKLARTLAVEGKRYIR
jgi:hypothetical protein